MQICFSFLVKKSKKNLKTELRIEMTKVISRETVYLRAFLFPLFPL